MTTPQNQVGQNQAGQNQAGQSQTARATRATTSRRRLFAAAMDLIGAEGPENVTVDRIAAAAGVAKGTVYYQFGSKNDLVTALLDEGFATMRDAIAPAEQHPDVMAALEGMITAALEWLEEFSGYAMLWTAEMMRPNSPWHSQIMTMRSELLDIIVTSLQRLPRRDERIEAESLAVAIFGATFVSGVAGRLPGTAAARKQSRAAQVAAIMCGVRAYAGCLDDPRPAAG